jgi:hypothetical protein
VIRISNLAPHNFVLFFIPIEGRAMTELKVNLDFSCAACRQTVSATVSCSGGPMSANSKVLASVAVPCPCCQTVNRVLFEPDGTIRDVACHLLSRIPEPSRN